MKVIDLLNKIANEGKVPEKIKYDGRFYIFNEKKHNYYENETCYINWDYVALHCLNEEIEIIEEPKKIEKIYHCCMEVSNEEIKFLIQNINILSDKINEIIDYINEDK